MMKTEPEGGIGNTGDGMLMAQAYGADTLDTQYIKATFGYRPDAKKYNTDTLHGYYDGAILVNSDAKRFVDESISYKLLSDAALEQKDLNVFEVFDEPLRVKRKISAWLGYNSPTRGQASLIKGLRAASGES